MVSNLPAHKTSPFCADRKTFTKFTIIIINVLNTIQHITEHLWKYYFTWFTNHHPAHIPYSTSAFLVLSTQFIHLRRVYNGCYLQFAGLGLLLHAFAATATNTFQSTLKVRGKIKGCCCGGKKQEFSHKVSVILLRQLHHIKVNLMA